MRPKLIMEFEGIFDRVVHEDAYNMKALFVNDESELVVTINKLYEPELPLALVPKRPYKLILNCRVMARQQSEGKGYYFSNSIYIKSIEDTQTGEKILSRYREKSSIDCKDSGA